jgi:hypothetical protein
MHSVRRWEFLILDFQFKPTLIDFDWTSFLDPGFLWSPQCGDLVLECIRNIDVAGQPDKLIDYVRRVVHP